MWHVSIATRVECGTALLSRANLPVTLDDSLDAIQTPQDLLEARPVGQADEGFVPVQLPSGARVHVEEDTRGTNDLLLQTLPEESPATVQWRRELPDVAPNVKGALRRGVYLDAHVRQPPQAEVPLMTEQDLQHDGLLNDRFRVQNRHEGPLHRQRWASVKEGPHRADGADHGAWCDNPTHAEPRHSPTLGETIEDHHWILVDILNKLCRRDDTPMGIRRRHPLRVDVA
mmetsp:Transcript_15838/g.55123  ORF Transcript_15838/g.55123 Transcript_15838/m.55123 type:complete len:229 (-) Transcript_15838:1155-1841(-)